jgi:deoxycytidylate deaminase
MDNYRIPADWYFLKMAFLAAERATCVRRKVGCILINSKKSYNSYWI